MRVVRAELVGIAIALLLTGCGSDEEPLRTLSGDRVALMAERQLEDEHPQMSPGTLACQDLVLELGASTRCTRTARLSEGRTVRINGTVEVTGVEDGGRLHVQLDDRAVAFGIAGDHLAERVRDRFALDAGSVTCPDLDGVVGASVRCELGAGSVEITVSGVDPEEYDVDYVVGPILAD